MLIVNLYGGPGAGKSTTAAGVFHVLKTRGVSCEYVPEYAKDLTWEDRTHALVNQPLILGKQYHRFWRLDGKVDVAVTDSPILLSVLYNNGRLKSLDALALELHMAHDNLNFLIKRTKPYFKVGRSQTEEEARGLDGKAKEMLDGYRFAYTEVPGNKWGLKKIVEKVELYLASTNNSICSKCGSMIPDDGECCGDEIDV